MKLKYLLPTIVVLAIAVTLLLGFEPLRAGTARIAANLFRGSNGINDNLVGYWSFDGADTSWATGLTNDLSGQGNNGHMIGMATSSAPRQGILGQALEFDGSDDYIDVANESNFDFERTDSFSASAWIKVSDPTVRQDIFGKQLQSGDFPGWNFRMNFANDGAADLAVSLANDFSPSNRLVVEGTTALQANRWYHVAFTYNGNSSPNGIAIYIDGVAESTVTTHDTLSASILNNVTLDIGANGEGGLFFVGVIDEARIYNRALSAAEVAELYRASAPEKRSNASVNTSKTLNTRNLIHYWTFDGAEMTSTSTTPNKQVNDLGSRNNDGWVVGGNVVPGVVGQGMVFTDSTSQHVNAGKSNFNGATFSVMGWARVDKAPAQFDQIVGTWSGVGTETAWSVGLNWGAQSCAADPGAFYLQLYSDNGTNKAAFSTGAGAAPFGQWFHFAAVRTATSEADLYIDGVLQSESLCYSENTLTADVTNADKPIKIHGRPFGGAVDAIRIYERALTAAEIEEIYRVEALEKRSNASVNTSKNLLNNGLVGYWSFDGVNMDWSQSSAEARDASGQGNHGDVTNFGTEGAVAGVAGQALNFDGSNDDIRLANDVFDALGDGTISAWIKADTFATNNRTIFTGAATANADNYVSFAVNTGSLFFVTAEVADTITYFARADDTPLDVGRWYHLSWTKAGTVHNLYINGVDQNINWVFDVSRDNYFDDVSAGTTAYTIGQFRRNSDANYFDGIIDELRVYNRALSAAEILELYNATKR